MTAGTRSRSQHWAGKEARIAVGIVVGRGVSISGTALVQAYRISPPLKRPREAPRPDLDSVLAKGKRPPDILAEHEVR